MQRGRRRGEMPALVALATTAWLIVQGVVGAATSGNTLRASHLTLDQYSPLPPYHHGFELYGRRSNDGNSQPEDEHRVNRKVEDDSVEYRSPNDRHRRRDFSIASISTNDFPVARRSYEVNVAGSNPRESSGRIVPSETIVRAGWRSKNFAGSKEFGKEGVDYAAAPPSEADEPFVADETFQDEGPGSVEIYKLDLFEEKKLPASVGPTLKMLGTLPVVPVTTRTTNNNNNNKSKVPKKSSRLAWKLGKSTSGVIKSTTSDATRTTKMMVTTGKDDGKDSKNLLHGRSSFSESELRSEAPPNGDAFGVGGVPELQVGCEGLEASSYFSRKLRRSVMETKNVTSQDDPSTELDIVPISLNLDYDWSDSSDEEMDELLKLKKLENETGKRKENRGDIDPVLDDFFNQESDVKEKLPIRGDLGNATVREESVKRLGESGLKRGRRSTGESSESSGYGSRKLLWTEDSEDGSDLWGYGEDEGILSSDGLDSDERRKHQERERRVQGRGRNEYERNSAKNEIDMIRQEYEKLLEQQRREEEARLRRLQELEARRSSATANERREEEERRRSYEERIRMEELRRREEARRREKEEEELRRRNPDDSRRNLTPEDRRSYEERRREWTMKRRQEEERRRQEEARNVPSNLIRSGYPYDRRNESRTREEEERMRLERERKLRENMERERQANRQRYGDDDSERRRMEDERRRYRLEQERSRNNVTREEEYRRRMEEERRRMEEERRRTAERREEERRKMMERRREEEERRRLEQHPSRNANTTRNRNEEEYRRRLEENQRRLEEERKLQEYIRRNQPIDPRVNERRNESNASRRREEEEEQQRRAIEAVRQLNRSRYPGLPSERRQHGPSAPTYIDPRVSLDESRRRQEIEASFQRRRQEEEQKRRQQEEKRREEEYRRQQSRRYEEERQRMEAKRREEERRRQYIIEEQRRRAAAAASSTRTRQDSWPGTRQDSQDRGNQRGRQDTASLGPSNLRRDGKRREMERERIRQEEERRRQQALARDNERRRHETRPNNQRDEYMRIMEEQRKRQEEARLNALPVSARIIVRGGGSSTHSRPSFPPRAGFGNEIDFPRLNPYNNGPKVEKFPSPSSKQTLVQSPGPCVWAVVQCCPTNTNRLVTCFESLGCPGVNWDPNPCRGAIADAARDEVMRFYAASEEENRF